MSANSSGIRTPSRWRLALLSSALLACDNSPRLESSYSLVSADGGALPATMFLAAGGASQILWGTIDLNDTTRAIYRWQYRVVGPGSAIHTLGVGVDTFAVRRVGNRVILGRYWPVGFDNPDSMFVADTAELRGGAFILTKRLNLEHAVETRRLRFTPGKN